MLQSVNTDQHVTAVDFVVIFKADWAIVYLETATVSVKFCKNEIYNDAQFHFVFIT